eukprot:CAMPEP_0119356304 /NCGR_PEP_ID=MMETSP1334-20130426/4942_1 /TAXON_ID=127549 /ORGANISM="Calcidiscus leptoporus, Strain RCC1130" /LENGTH=93 /DNA_ID=CAMNT_0007370311 /DNA_START=407 /DNA_END=689 /DNA_ORIENTATION=+
MDMEFRPGLVRASSGPRPRPVPALSCPGHVPATPGYVPAMSLPCPGLVMSRPRPGHVPAMSRPHLHGHGGIAARAHTTSRALESTGTCRSAVA